MRDMEINHGMPAPTWRIGRLFRSKTLALCMAFAGGWTSMLANAADQSLLNPRMPCPTIGTTINGVLIRGGVQPTSKVEIANPVARLPVVTREMAMTPLAFSTAAGIRMRVPANVLVYSECNERGEIAHIRLRLMWDGSKAIPTADWPSSKPDDWQSSIDVYIRFYSKANTPRGRPVDLQEVERQLRLKVPGVARPDLKMILYEHPIEKVGRDWWDYFVVPDNVDSAGRVTVIQCQVRKVDWERGIYPTNTTDIRICRTSRAIHPRASAAIDFYPSSLRSGPQLIDQVDRLMRSYIVGD